MFILQSNLLRRHCIFVPQSFWYSFWLLSFFKTGAYVYVSGSVTNLRQAQPQIEDLILDADDCEEHSLHVRRKMTFTIQWGGEEKKQMEQSHDPRKETFLLKILLRKKKKKTCLLVGSRMVIFDGEKGGKIYVWGVIQIYPVVCQCERVGYVICMSSIDTLCQEVYLAGVFRRRWKHYIYSTSVLLTLLTF